MDVNRARIKLRPLFNFLSKEGGGQIKCNAWLGIIEMRIGGKWAPLMPTSKIDIEAIAEFKRIRIGFDCVKIFSRKHGRKIVFHKIPYSDFHSVSLLSSVISNNFIGVFHNNIYHLLTNVKFISSLCADIYNYYDEDMKILFKLIGTVSYTKKLGYFTIIKNILCVHSTAESVFAMFSDCANVEACLNLPDALIINEKIYRFCPLVQQLRSDDGDVKYCMRNTVTNYRVIWESYILEKLTLKADLRHVVAVCGIYIAHNSAGTHFEEVCERAPAGSGKHTKQALRT